MGGRVVERPNTTFKPRRRSLSATRQADLARWAQHWALDEAGPEIDFTELFGDLPVVLDIGFGRGEGTLAMARADHGTAIVGVEVHTPGVAAVLDAIDNDPLRHVRVVHGDVLRFLTRVPTESLSGIRIYFPDPWPKHRHHSRRLVRDDVIDALAQRLAIGGFVHLATDIADYAEQMQAACDRDPRLIGGVIERPHWRPVTRFEQRGIDEGRAAIDLWYERRSTT